MSYTHNWNGETTSWVATEEWNAANEAPIGVLEAPAQAAAAPAALPNADETEFQALAQEWLKATRHISATSKKVIHPAYQRIIGMGPKALPWILAEIEQRPAHWFHALEAITGANPVPQADRGQVREMARAWVAWGRQTGALN